MPELVQISKRSGRIDRVKRGETPVIELHLEPEQYVANVELHEIDRYDLARKTVDWSWTVFVVTPLGGPS